MSYLDIFISKDMKKTLLSQVPDVVSYELYEWFIIH